MSDFSSIVPEIFSNSTVNAVVLTIIPGIFYTLAAYGHTFVKGLALGWAILISIIFAAIEYIFRVPINSYSTHKAKLSNGAQQTIWVGITLALGWLSDLFVAA